MRENLAGLVKTVALAVLFFVAAMSAVGTYFAFGVTTNYSMEQFLPKKHSLLTWDQESKRLFHIFDTSPYIVLLSLDKSENAFWYEPKPLAQLQRLTDQITAVQSSYEQKSELLVSTLGDLQKRGFEVNGILKDPLFTPNLIS